MTMNTFVNNCFKNIIIKNYYVIRRYFVRKKNETYLFLFKLCAFFFWQVLFLQIA
jgi:hypothetical protein